MAAISTLRGASSREPRSRAHPQETQHMVSLHEQGRNPHVFLSWAHRTFCCFTCSMLLSWALYPLALAAWIRPSDPSPNPAKGTKPGDTTDTQGTVCVVFGGGACTGRIQVKHQSSTLAAAATTAATAIITSMAADSK